MHALTDLVGRPYALMLTPGNVSDMKGAPALLERAGGMRYLLGSKDDDTDRLRSLDRDIGATPAHAHHLTRCNRKPQTRHPLRQAGCYFPVRRGARTRSRLLALNGSET